MKTGIPLDEVADADQMWSVGLVSATAEELPVAVAIVLHVQDIAGAAEDVRADEDAKMIVLEQRLLRASSGFRCSR